MSACRIVVCALLVTTVCINTTPLPETTGPVNKSSTPYATTVNINLSLATSTQSVATGDSWTWVDFPNPQLDIQKCGNDGVKSWVCDPAELLTAQEGWLLSFGFCITVEPHYYGHSRDGETVTPIER